MNDNLVRHLPTENSIGIRSGRLTAIQHRKRLGDKQVSEPQS